MPGSSALLYEIRAKAGGVLAADVGPTTVRLALADLVGRIVVRGQEPSQAWSYDGVRGQLARLAGEIAAEAGLEPADVTVTVFGTPGIHDKESGALRLAPKLPAGTAPARWTRRPR